MFFSQHEKFMDQTRLLRSTDSKHTSKLFKWQNCTFILSHASARFLQTCKVKYLLCFFSNTPIFFLCVLVYIFSSVSYISNIIRLYIMHVPSILNPDQFHSYHTKSCQKLILNVFFFGGGGF